MANTLMSSAREAFAAGDIDWTGDDIVVVLVTDDYTFDPDHSVLDDVAGGAIVWISDPLDNTTAAGGVLDADDVLTDPLDTGDTISGLYIVQDTGNTATSRLIVWFDQELSGMPIGYETSGLPVGISWPQGPTRIARI